MKDRFWLVFGFFISFHGGNAQSLRVVDAKTKEPIAFYHLYDARQNAVLIGSEEGFSSLEEIRAAFVDTLIVSHLGYEKGIVRLSQIRTIEHDFFLELTPAFIDLESATARILNEDSLFQNFQKKLKDQLSQNSWLVRVHLWETVPLQDYFEEHFALMGFGGVIERKGRNGSFEEGHSFILSEAARRNDELKRTELFTTKNMVGIVLNELLKEVRDVKLKSVIPIQSSSEGDDVTIAYHFKESNLHLVLSEAGNLLSISWNQGKTFHLPKSDAIRADVGELKFYDNPNILVPISIKLDYEHLESGEERTVRLLASFIPSSVNFVDYLNKNYKTEDYFRLMRLCEDYTGYDAANPFFESTKAAYAIRRMENFSEIDFEGRNWRNVSSSELIEISNSDSAWKRRMEDVIRYRNELLEYYKSQGLAW